MTYVRIWFAASIMFLCLLSSAQIQTYVQIGGCSFGNTEDVPYFNRTLCYKGHAGLNLALPIYQDKLLLESGLLFGFQDYSMRGPLTNVQPIFLLGSSFKVKENINNTLLIVPLNLVLRVKRFEPFIGIEFNKYLSNNTYGEFTLYQASGTFSGFEDLIHIEGNYSINISPVSFNLNAGLNYGLNPNLKFKLSYGYGLTDFASFSISPGIVNGNNTMGNIIKHTRVNQLLLAVLFTPVLRNKSKGNKENGLNMRRITLKDFIK